MFRFAIRELVLLTTITGMAAGWWVDHRMMNRERIELAQLLSDRESMLDIIVPGWRLPAAERARDGRPFRDDPRRAAVK
jgi:hypothetical protein